MWADGRLAPSCRHKDRGASDSHLGHREVCRDRWDWTQVWIQLCAAPWTFHVTAAVSWAFSLASGQLVKRTGKLLLAKDLTKASPSYCGLLGHTDVHLSRKWSSRTFYRPRVPNGKRPAANWLGLHTYVGCFEGKLATKMVLPLYLLLPLKLLG